MFRESEKSLKEDSMEFYFRDKLAWPKKKRKSYQTDVIPLIYKCGATNDKLDPMC